MNLCTYGIWRHFRIERPEKKGPCQKLPLIVIPSRNIKDKSLILHHTSLSLILSRFQTEGTGTNFEGLVWDAIKLCPLLVSPSGIAIQN